MTSTAADRAARPFLKWAGGKGRLLAQLEPFFPRRFRRYVEPFVGGGAVFFHLWNAGRLPAAVILSDHNEELINAYRVVRDQVEALVDRLAEHRRRHSRAHYYAIRALDRRPDPGLDAVARAARTIYLNRTCYNGLYRVNRRGQFNVPMGRYANPAILNAPVLRAASRALQAVSLDTLTLEDLVAPARPGDFYYFDPPYDPVSPTANFTSYTAGDFGEADQRRLAAVYRALTGRGCLCMLSNSHTPLIRELYAGFRLEVVRATRAINSNAARRGAIDELVVLNY